jgi:hypothetical protein
MRAVLDDDEELLFLGLLLFTLADDELPVLPLFFFAAFS